MAFITASLCGADETFPVVHNEPITIRIVGGRNGLPLSNLHLVLIGGYDRSDLHDQLYREEVLTDTYGNVRLPKQLANLPWLQVWVSKMPLCQSKPRKASFSVELIRRDGLSAPNLCGPVSAQDTPGVFTVFVKNKATKLHTGASISVGMPLTRSPIPTQMANSIADAASPIISPSTTKAAPAALAPVETPLDPAPKAALIAPVAVPAPANPPASVSAILPAKTSVPIQPRRVAAKPAVHRSKPHLVACLAQPPVAKAAPAHQARERSRRALPRKTPVSATRRSKPLAGVRLAAKMPAHPTPPKQE